jgi:Icc-related predicted phosphoesterase
MKILLIADLHDINENNIKKIKNIEYDICFLLGDINNQGLSLLKKYIDLEKTVGITGNHEDFGLLKRNNIQDINLKMMNFNGINIFGISGSVRYKRGMYSLYTQDELSSLIDVDNMPKCDILISHESGFHFISDDTTHEGFKIIDQILQKNQPKYNLFGHHHQNLSFVKYNTQCICTYQCNILDFDTGEITHMDFPSVIAHTRNYYIHYDESIKAQHRVLSEEELQFYNRSLLQMLEYYILLELM